MKILLDTNILIWVTASPEKVPENILHQIQDTKNTIFFSAASIWEIAIKHTFGKPDFFFNPLIIHQALVENNYTELPITSNHAIAIQHLQKIHKDPFDRMLIAQAIAENMLLMTADQTIVKYPAPVLFVNRADCQQKLV